MDPQPELTKQATQPPPASHLHLFDRSSPQKELAQCNRAVEDAHRLAAIVESSDDAIIAKDLNGIIMNWNRAAERIFGYAAEEVIGKPVTILMPPERENEEPGILRRIRSGERVDHYETVRRRKDGTLLEISLTVSPIRNAEGQIVGASKIARDITERKRADRELREMRDELARANEDLERRVEERTASLTEAIAQMEEFSYSVSHDLRAPVRAMHAYAQALIEDYGERLDEEGRDFLQRILRGSSRMDRLIQDVLVYSRLARADLHFSQINLDRLVMEIVQNYPDIQPPKVQVDVAQPLLGVVGHEPSLVQAVSNLLGNAAKFVAPGTTPHIRVSTERRGRLVRLWVEDNGIGIKREHQSRLFGMFQRVHADRRYEGTGIGLAIVRKAAERMGGRVGVESDGISGSRFWLELPAVD